MSRGMQDEYWQEHRAEIAELARRVSPEEVQRAVVAMCAKTEGVVPLPFLHGWLESALERQEAQKKRQEP